MTDPSYISSAATLGAVLDPAVMELRETSERWARLPLARKIEYARQALQGTARTAEGQVQAAVAAKGLSPDSPATGEEWIAGPYITLRVLRLLIETLEGLRRDGRVPLDPSWVGRRKDGRASVDVFPLTFYDQSLYAGFRAQVRMQDGVTPENLDQHMAGFYRRKDPKGRVALVLGAGNVASIGPLDVVHKLFVEGQVVILKFNPVNEYLGPFFEDAFGDLIRDGYLRTAYGGADVGAYLCEHPEVDEIHITGGAPTHDAIVFGVGPEGKERKHRNEPLLEKRITSELGNVSPVIVAPGRWSTSQIRFQAQNLATQMVQNSSFNCNAARIIVTHEAWPQRQELLDELGHVISRLPARPAYYPGAEERYERFVAAYPTADRFGPRATGALPAALAVGLDPDAVDQPAFSTESFCPFTAEVPLVAQSAAEFLGRAATFCNDRLYGTLNAEILIDPMTEKRLRPELEAAIDELRYGTVAINQWPAMGFALGSTPWGAFPGHTLDDIQSGMGSVHNTFLFDRPEKTVIRGPFTVFPKPPWFVTHANAHRVGERLARFEADPGPLRLAGIVLAALRG
ncbi:MAG: aldehyde dehydrogenase family protein [Acidobacteriota bacterium]|nr:aldehyde dehydrogenase family protein [Acidobacteriota bacterium]